MISYASELAKTRKDINALESICARDDRDLEKRVRLAYRQFHQASLTENESDFAMVKRTISGILRDFGPKEDVCLLKANVDGHFHCLEEVKHDLLMCPSLAQRPAGRALAADIDFQEGRYEQARIRLKELIDENPAWDSLARLAHWKGKLGDLQEADRLYREAEDQLTAKELLSFSWLELQQGALAVSRGRYREAHAHYKLAADSFPGHWHTDKHVAGLFAAEGHFDQAVLLMRSVVARAPKPEFKLSLGELLLTVGRTEEARPWLDDAVAEFLSSARAGAVHYYHHLADWYSNLGGRPAEAVQWARKDVALRSNFSTQSALAWALFKNGEIPEGLVRIRLALASRVKDAGIFARAASLFRAAGDTTQGERYARAAKETNPSSHGFHMDS
jgi:tetratricopeptide (TPR) repeat protein